MKNLFVLALLCSVIAVACHKKAVPVISDRTEFPPAPRSAKQPAADNNPETIAAGKTLYEGKCGRCHDLKDPKIYSTDRWSTILKAMAPRARLNDEQTKEVTAYVMANAKK